MIDQIDKEVQANGEIYAATEHMDAARRKLEKAAKLTRSERKLKEAVKVICGLLVLREVLL